MGNAASSRRAKDGKDISSASRHRPRFTNMSYFSNPSPSVASSSFEISSRNKKPAADDLSPEPPCPYIETLSYRTHYDAFIAAYPIYEITSAIDDLRRRDFTRLAKSRETYLDYMGGCLYPESLVKGYTDFLTSNILGNTHSVSNSSNLSTRLASEARAAVLKFFDVPPGYTVVFTANATAALKLVGESFPFRDGGTFVLPADCHNSVNGIRKYATQGGASVYYLKSESNGGINMATAEATLSQHRPNGSPCLYIITGLSNISNAKTPLDMATYAKSLGYHVVLDAAALAATSKISLREGSIDAMAISFYKMFGFPTGVGALVVREGFLQMLSRPWFAGGAVDVVQVPGSLVTMADDLHEQFQDGTINYLSLPAITRGLDFLSPYLSLLPIRLSALLNYTYNELEHLRHEQNGAPVIKLLSAPPSQKPLKPDEPSPTGFTISLLFIEPSGKMIPNSFIEYSAARANISLRTGCVCNPGGAAAILGIEDDMQLLTPGVTLKQFEEHVGHELGVIRISLGLVSSFDDVQRFLEFASAMTKIDTRQRAWDEWLLAKNSVVHSQQIA